LGIVKFIIKLLLYPIIYYNKKFDILSRTSQQYKCLLDTSDAIVLLSDRYIKEFNKIANSKTSSKCKIVGIPNPNTYNKIINSQSKKHTILFVGRLCASEKNPMRLLRLWRLLHKTYKDWNIKFVGNGDALDSMQRYVKSHNLERVIFCGEQSNVERYYAEASFICLTSNIEGWGMTLTEGMQYGCIPIAFSSYSAALDIIDDEINGCLIRPYSIRQYASRLSSLMKDKSLRDKMSNAARVKVKCFNVSNVARKWDCLFNELYDDV
jgi:glycosyltransferase involved in cell wall biosynthesis